MSEAAEYPVKDIMVTGNVSLQKNLQDVLIVTKVALVDMYTIQGENNTAVIYYVLQMNGREPVCAHSRYKISSRKGISIIC